MKTTLTPLALAGLLMGAALPATASAQGAPVPAADVRGGTYAVEPAHTQVLFSVLHLGFTRFDGVFSKASGSLRLAPRSPAVAALDVDVPVASVSTTSAKLDDELRSPDWLDAARYPTLHFHSTQVVRTGPDTADVTGDLSLHGITRPVTLRARFIGAGVNPLSHAYTVGFQISGRVDRSQFGVSKYVPLVSDEVQLDINAAFEKTP